MRHINPLKKNYPLIIRLTTLVGIILIILNFLIYPRFINTLSFETVDQLIIENIDIPQTQQIDNTPPPARPSIPVPSDDEDIAEDLTLDELDFDDFSNMDAPPPPPSGPKVVFIPYDDPPVAMTPIRPVYPEIAQEAGIEGVIVVQAFIDEKGRVKETLITLDLESIHIRFFVQVLHLSISGWGSEAEVMLIWLTRPVLNL